MAITKTRSSFPSSAGQGIPLESFEKGVAFFKMYIKRMT